MKYDKYETKDEIWKYEKNNNVSHLNSQISNQDFF